MSRSFGMGNVSQFMLGNRPINMVPPVPFQPLTMPLATGVADLMNYCDPKYKDLNNQFATPQNMMENPVTLEENDDSMSVSSEDEDARTIFCGNIEERVDEEMLYELFLQAGPVERVCIPKDRSGRPRCFAFVTYVHKCSPDYALKLFDGLVLYNKSIQLSMKSIKSMANKRSASTALLSQNAKRCRSEVEEDSRVTVLNDMECGGGNTLSADAYNRLQSFVNPCSWLQVPSLMSKIIVPVNQYLNSINSNLNNSNSGIFRNNNSPNYKEKPTRSHGRRQRQHAKERQQRWDDSKQNYSARKYRKL